jgi:hypothetical protein
VRFIADEPKLIHALAELEQEPWARSGSIHSIETIEIDLGPDEEPVPWRRSRKLNSDLNSRWSVIAWKSA